MVGLATLAGAWFFEYVLKYQPCPLCLEERIPYHVVIPLSLLVAIAAFVGAPRKLVMVGFVAIIAAVLFNVVLSTYHAGIEWRWWAGPPDCTGPVTDFKAGGGLARPVADDPCSALRRGGLALSRHLACGL